MSEIEKSKYDRSAIDDISKRQRFKEHHFGEKKTVEDPYTGKTLHKESKAAANKYGPNHATQHSSDVDHVTPLAKIHKQYSSNEFLDTTDLKKIGNIDANYQVIASTVNRQKGEKTNFEYIKNADIPVVGKIKMVMNQVSSETAIGIEAAKLTTKNILKSVNEKGIAETVKAAGRSIENSGEAAMEAAGITMDVIRNSTTAIVAVASGKMNAAEAGTYVVNGVGQSVKGSVENKIISTGVDFAIRKLNLVPYAQAVYTAVVVGKIVGQNAILLINGEITSKQFWSNVGESGARLIGQAVGTVAGALLGPLGAMVGGMIASEVCGAVYGWIQRVKEEGKLTQKKLDYLSSVEKAALRAIDEESQRLGYLIEQDRRLWEQTMEGAFSAMEKGLFSDNPDEFTSGLAMITEYFGAELQYKNSEDFKKAFRSDDFSIIL